MTRAAAAVLIAALAVASAAFATAPGTTAARHVVIGSKKFAPGGDGWGTSRPRRLYNGGDPSGLAFKIHWRAWGTKRARGRGRTYTYKPGGGYYRRSVRIKLRAYRLGHCSRGGPPAYRRLKVKVQKRPGGRRYTRWLLWSGAKTLCKNGFGG